MAAYLDVLTSTQLFMLNGVLEGLVSILVVLAPGAMLGAKTVSKHGTFFAGFFGPLLFGMSLVSAAMSKLSDSDNDAKHLFACGWCAYHIGASYNCFKALLGGKKAMIVATVFHTFMAASFFSYLQANHFSLGLLMPF